MKKYMRWQYFGLTLLVFLSLCFAGSEPNYVEVTVKADNPDHDVVSREYSDGTGKVIQKQVKLNDRHASIISGSYFDEAGRVQKAVKRFVLPLVSRYFEHDLLDGESGFNNGARAYYNGIIAPDAENYPYSESVYYTDPLGRVKQTGAPGLAFSVDATNGHPIKTWYFGTTGSNTAAGLSTYFDENGFIQPGFLNDANLENQVPAALNALNGVGINYFLVVVQDPNGNFSQEMKDKADNVIRKWSDASTAAGDEIVSKYRYDSRGNIVEEIPPAADVNSSTYEYNTLNQLVCRVSPDKGEELFTYDILGRNETYTNAQQSAENEHVAYDYDRLGRQITTSLVRGGTTYIKIRHIYDNPVKVQSYVSEDIIPYTVLDKYNTNNTEGLKFSRGQVCAIIYYNEDVAIGAANEMAAKRKTVTVFSYDDEYRVERRFKKIPWLPLHKTTFTYDKQGKVTSELVEYGENAHTTTYIYTSQGQLNYIEREGRKYISFVYDDLGALTKKIFWHEDQVRNFEIDYEYTIRDWIKSIDAGSIFTETLEYTDNVASPQYNGNIAASLINQSTPLYSAIDLAYTYDKVNRLTAVHNSASYGTGTNDDAFDASYSYDNNGRFVRKNETFKNNTSEDWNDYQYKTGTNQLRYIENSPKDLKEDTDNYLYDLNGNMIVDKSKNMVITYDWRDMPVKFAFYNQIPADVDTWQEVEAIDHNSQVTRLSYVEMMYDADGNRVMKRSFK